MAWFRSYRRLLIASDLVAVVLASLLGALLRFGDLAHRPDNTVYAVAAAAIIVIWLISLSTAGAYDVRHLGLGMEEAKRVARGSAVTLGAVAAVCYVSHVDLARGYVAIVIPLGVVVIGVTRAALRRQVTRLRRDGRWTQRILACGTTESVDALIDATRRARRAGLTVVGACVEDAAPGSVLRGEVPVVGDLRSVAGSAELVDADVVALGATGLGSARIRELSWELEGTGRAMAMAPGLTEVAGPRVYVSPVEGLPLMWVEQPQFSGLTRVVKRMVDLVGASVVLLLASPVLLAVTVAIRVTSPGPILFRQSRLGQHGKEFMVLKFRSMHTGSEARRAELLARNENDGGVLFKMQRDPRVTDVGRVIRRLSIDELPQLFNVLSGTMSLVGPRPLATEDSHYDGHARRRLLVKPGMTGLWQVSGRSDLSWEDAVRLDLYYVENWSLAFDATIVVKTVNAVLRSRGAY